MLFLSRFFHNLFCIAPPIAEVSSLKKEGEKQEIVGWLLQEFQGLSDSAN